MPELISAAPGSPEWLAARRQGVTATDIVTILGLSSWDSPYSLYWRKLGQVPEVPDNDRFRLGRHLEPYVHRRWHEEVDPERHTCKPGALYRHSERSWQMATLDAQPENAVLEVKTWADADKPAWSDGPPPAVRAQVLWQMDVMDVATGHVGVVFLPSGEFRSYTIQHDDGDQCRFNRSTNPPDACLVCFDQAIMLAEGEVFMARLRLELPAPDPDASAASLAAVRARFAKAPDKTAEVDKTTWSSYYETCEYLRQIEDRKRDQEIKLREQAGEASVLTVDGQPVARRIVGEAQVKAHTRHSDYLKRIKTEADSE